MGKRTGGMWNAEEQGIHINILELMAVRLALLTFNKEKQLSSIHFQIDNKTALKYLLKMGGTKSAQMVDISKEIWEYLLSNGITITGEYLPSPLNVEADWESRNVQDNSEWKLSPKVFQRICQMREVPVIDLFASRLSNQVKNYMAWKLDPFSIATDALQQNWSVHRCLYAFPPFSLILRILRKVDQEKVEKLILVTPDWQTQVWYPRVMEMSIANPILLPKLDKLLINPSGQIHPLVANKSLRLVAWTISGKSSLRQAFQSQLSTFCQVQEEKVLRQITIRPGESGLAGVLNTRLIQFTVM